MRGCIHPSTGSPDLQAPEEALSEKLGEGKDGVDGGGEKKTGAPRAPIMEVQKGDYT